MNIDYKNIGLRIRHARKQNGITQEQLADLIYSSLSFVGKMETGEKGLSVETLVEISNALNVSTDYILAESLEISSNTENPFDSILIDCNAAEQKFLLRCIHALKTILKETL